MASAKKLPSGNWRVQVYMGKDSAGKRLYQSFTAPTRKEAEYKAALGRVHAQHKAADGPTIGEAIDRYIDAKKAVLSPSTVMGYTSMRRNIFPGLMPMHEAALDTETVQKAVSDYAKSHSPKSVRNAYALLTSACQMVYGRSDFKATLPQKQKPRLTIPTHAQIGQLLENTKGTPMYTAIILCASLGLRRSEVCALDWVDVDFKKQTIAVNKAMVPADDFTWVIKPPKTEDSDRIIRQVPEYVLQHLRSLPRNSSRVIDSMTPSVISSRFIALRNRLGMRCRFHDLRHYHASIMHALGIPNKYAMARMGHATDNMLKRVYQHLMDDKENDVDQAISARLSDLYK